ncbi:MAG: hypothetical protein IJ333_10625 [Clostridia bacterium]|nr:hypothetical protein [Clostridia bacterium]
MEKYANTVDTLRSRFLSATPGGIDKTVVLETTQTPKPIAALELLLRTILPQAKSFEATAPTN